MSEVNVSELKKLSYIQGELLQIEDYILKLENNKDTVSQDTYNKLFAKYDEQKTGLEEELNQLKSKYIALIQEIKKDIQLLQSQKEECDRQIHEMKQLRDAGALSLEDYQNDTKANRQKSSDLGKKITVQNNLIKEIDFYLTHQGDVDYGRESLQETLAKGASLLKEQKKDKVSGFSKGPQKRSGKFALAIKSAFYSPQWTHSLSAQIKFFSLILIISFFIPWIVNLSNNEFLGTDGKIVWSWNFSEHIKDYTDYQIDEKLNILEDMEEEENIREHSGFKKLRLDFGSLYENYTISELESDIEDLIDSLQDFKLPLTVLPVPFLIFGLVTAVIIFSGKVKKLFLLLVALIIVIDWLATSNIFQNAGLFNIIIGWSFPVLHNLHLNVYLFLAGIAILSLASALMLHKKVNSIFVRVGLLAGMVLLLLHLLLPVTLYGESAPLLLHIIRAFKNFNNDYLSWSFIIIHLGINLIGLSIGLIEFIVLKSRNNQEITSGLIYLPAISVFLILVALLINIALTEVIFSALFIIAVLLTFLLLWSVCIAGYFIAALLTCFENLLFKKKEEIT